MVLFCRFLCVCARYEDANGSSIAHTNTHSQHTHSLERARMPLDYFRRERTRKVWFTQVHEHSHTFTFVHKARQREESTHNRTHESFVPTVSAFCSDECARSPPSSSTVTVRNDFTIQMYEQSENHAQDNNSVLGHDSTEYIRSDFQRNHLTVTIWRTTMCFFFVRLFSCLFSIIHKVLHVFLDWLPESSIRNYNMRKLNSSVSR